MKSWLTFLVLCVATGAHSQRVEVPVQPRPALPTVELSHLRGYLADPIGARIPKANIILQKKNGKALGNVESVQSGQSGEFDFSEVLPGLYRLAVSVRGFCDISVPIRFSGKGWPGLRITLPVGVTDTPSGYCEKQVKIERLDE